MAKAQPKSSRSPAFRNSKSSRKKNASPNQSLSIRRVRLPNKHGDNSKCLPPREDALKRLGLTSEQVKGLPQLKPIFSQAVGGINAVLESLRGSDDEGAQKFISRYDDLSADDKRRLRLEEISLGAGVPPRELVGIVASCLLENSQSLGRIIAATSAPRVIKKTVKRAMDDSNPDALDYTKAVLQGVGFLPTAKAGTSIYVNNQAAIQNQVTMEQEEQESVLSEDWLKKLHEDFEGRKLLDEPRVVEGVSAEISGHQYEELQEEVAPAVCIPSKKS